MKALLKLLLTSIIVAIPLGTRTKRDVPSSNKYKNTIVCEKALHKTVLDDNPAIEVCDFQNDTSFLNERKSNKS